MHMYVCVYVCAHAHTYMRACVCAHAHRQQEQVHGAWPSWARWDSYSFNGISPAFFPAPFLVCPSPPTFHQASSLQGPSPVGVLQNFHLLPKLQVLCWTRLYPTEEKEKGKPEFIRGTNTKPGARMEAGGVQRKNKQRSSYSREIRKRARPTWIGEKGEDTQKKKERERERD